MLMGSSCPDLSPLARCHIWSKVQSPSNRSEQGRHKVYHSDGHHPSPQLLQAASPLVVIGITIRGSRWRVNPIQTSHRPPQARLNNLNQQHHKDHTRSSCATSWHLRHSKRSVPSKVTPLAQTSSRRLALRPNFVRFRSKEARLPFVEPSTTAPASPTRSPRTSLSHGTKFFSSFN